MLELPKVGRKQVKSVPTKELGYALGVILGDGNLNHETSHYSIRLEATDLNFVDRFADALHKLCPTHKIQRYERYRTRKFPRSSKLYSFHMYGAKLYSKQIYTFLLKLKREIENGWIPDDIEFIESFVRGFYDSEGGHKDRVYVSCTNKKLIEIMHKFLQVLGFNPTKVHRTGTPALKSLWRIDLCRKDEVKEFLRRRTIRG